MAKVKWFGHAFFEIVSSSSKRIYIDPWIENPSSPIKKDAIEDAVFVLVTHDHFDHTGDAVDVIKMSGAKLVANVETAGAIRENGGLTEDQVVYGGYGLNIGGSVRENEITVTMVQAFHSSGTGVATGYIVKLDDGVTIYHAGDTGIFASMELFGRMYDIDIALLPIGGVFTMDPYQAAYAASLMKPKVVIPMHYKSFPILVQDTSEWVSYMEKIASEVETVVIEPGEEYTFEK